MTLRVLLTAAVLALVSSVTSTATLLTGSVTVGWDPSPQAHVSGYKIHYGTSPGSYPNVIDVGSATEADIPDLVERRAYFCAVTAYGSDGSVSGFSEELIIVWSSKDTEEHGTGARLILIEAESGTVVSPLRISSSGEISWVESSDSDPTGSVSLPFTASVAGNYSVWCRVIAPDASRNSYFVSLNGGEESVFEANDPATGSFSGEWVWRRVDLANGFTLDPGNHILRFRVRQPGVKLDRIVLSSSSDFTPTDDLPRTGDVLSIVRQPTNKWTHPGSGVTLQVEAVSTLPLQYQWAKNGVALEDQTSPSLTISHADSGDQGSYSVTLWNEAWAALSDSATLTILTGSPQVNSLARNSATSLSFNVSNIPGDTVEVYASDDLADWKLIGTAPVISGTITIQDPEAAGEPRRFYQLRTP